MLCRRIIYALLSQPVVAFYGEALPQALSGAPSLDPAGGLSSQTHNLSTMEKILRAPMHVSKAFYFDAVLSFFF